MPEPVEHWKFSIRIGSQRNDDMITSLVLYVEALEGRKQNQKQFDKINISPTFHTETVLVPHQERKLYEMISPHHYASLSLTAVSSIPIN